MREFDSQTPEAMTTLKFSVYEFINIKQDAHPSRTRFNTTPQLNTVQA